MSQLRRMWVAAKPVRKALVAGGMAAVGSLITSTTQHQPTWADVGTAVGVGLAAGWATWKVRNHPDTGSTGTR